jgi:hypothetical protein
MPTGRTFGGGFVSEGLSRMRLNSTIAGVHSVRADLTASCDLGDAIETVLDPGETGTRGFPGPQSLDPFRWRRSVTFPGGCVVFVDRFTSGAPASRSLVVNDASGFVPRGDVVAAVRGELGETVCGAGASPCFEG